MTIEEKAQRYDEAIKRAKSLLSDNQLGNAWIYKLLPELKESENVDEKVRKALIKLVTNHASMDLFIEYDIHLDEALSWLEKQSEQKSMKTCAEYYNKDSELKMPELSVFQNKLADILMQREYEGSTETEEDVASARLDYELAAIRISEELLPLAIMQKPTEWSEEDKEIVKALNDYVKNLDILFSEIRIGDKDILSKEFREKVQLWLKFIKDRVQPQPKQEWSEEDEEMLNSIKFHLDCDRANINCYSWLDELKDRVQPQSQWKPSDLPYWKKSTLPNDNTTGFNSDYFCYKGYNINYKELFEKLPKDD